MKIIFFKKTLKHANINKNFVFSLNWREKKTYPFEVYFFKNKFKKIEKIVQENNKE